MQPLQTKLLAGAGLLLRRDVFELHFHRIFQPGFCGDSALGAGRELVCIVRLFASCFGDFVCVFLSLFAGHLDQYQCALRPFQIKIRLIPFFEKTFFIFVGIFEKTTEKCRSGRSGRTRNAVYSQGYRGFESLLLRNIFE